MWRYNVVQTFRVSVQTLYSTAATQAVTVSDPAGSNHGTHTQELQIVIKGLYAHLSR
jgi:hypothetical protein